VKPDFEIFWDECPRKVAKLAAFKAWRVAIKTATPQEARSSGADQLGLKAGDRVVHDRFGPGTVLSVAGEGERTRAFVRFDEGQAEKQLVLSISPLKRL
jgi:DNA helicase-2/ATP-dependent DNA helicase PcrA